MTNFSYSEAVDGVFPDPIASFSYRDIGNAVLSHLDQTRRDTSAPVQETKEQAPSGPSEQEITDLLNRARLEAVSSTEKRLREEYEARSAAEGVRVRQALESFIGERKNYFSRVESDVVSLALAIAGKILHREAQVDTMLVAALVRVAVEKLHDGSSVSVRVSPAKAEKWRQYLANPLNGSTVAVIEDTHLGTDDCILETDLGSADFGIDAQLKEVEQGFFDLLAQRPQVK
jgi:flagellar assembly protein FliH